MYVTYEKVGDEDRTREEGKISGWEFASAVAVV
jgi:hypothetical protein